MTLTARSLSPRSAWLTVLAVAVVAVFALGAQAFVHAQKAEANCARTPQQHPPDSIGVSQADIRLYLADKYATRAKYVVPRSDGANAIEMDVFDAGGDFSHGSVRVVRDREGSGWLIATTNTCDD